jgi:hypothetical protein
MNTDDMLPGQTGDDESLEQLLRDVCELADETVRRITDAEVDARLQRLLDQTGHSSATTPDPGLVVNPDPACALRAAQHEAAEILAVAHRKAREMAAMSECTAAQAAVAHRRAECARAEAEQFADEALKRAASIVAAARLKAESIIGDAESEAQEIVVAARTEADLITTQAQQAGLRNAGIHDNDRLGFALVLRNASGTVVRHWPNRVFLSGWAGACALPSLVSPIQVPYDLAVPPGTLDAVGNAVAGNVTDALASALDTRDSLTRQVFLHSSMLREMNLGSYRGVADAVAESAGSRFLIQCKSGGPVPAIYDDTTTMRSWSLLVAGAASVIAHAVAPSDSWWQADDTSLPVNDHRPAEAETDSSAGVRIYTSTYDEVAPGEHTAGLLSWLEPLAAGKLSLVEGGAGRVIPECDNHCEGAGNIAASCP